MGRTGQTLPVCMERCAQQQMGGHTRLGAQWEAGHMESRGQWTGLSSVLSPLGVAATQRSFLEGALCSTLGRRRSSVKRTLPDSSVAWRRQGAQCDADSCLAWGRVQRWLSSLHRASQQAACKGALVAEEATLELFWRSLAAAVAEKCQRGWIFQPSATPPLGHQGLEHCQPLHQNFGRAPHPE